MAALHSLQVLDTAPEPEFDSVSDLAKALAGTEIALVSLVGQDRQWFKAARGMDVCQTSRDVAFCAHTIQADDVLWVEDARADRRFRDNPLVVGEPSVRFYAGAPITVDGSRVGAVCVKGREARPFDSELAARLADLAEVAADRLKLRRLRLETESAARESAAARDTMALLVRSAPTSLVMTDSELRIVDVSDRWTAYYDRPREAVVGSTMHELFPAARELWEPIYRRCLAGAREGGEQAMSAKEGDRRWFQWEAAPWRDAGGAVAGLLLSSYDVTDLVLAKERAERDQRRLTLAVEIAHLVVWEADLLKQSLQVHGGDPGALFGRPLTFAALSGDEVILVHPEDRGRVRDAWRRHLSSGEPFRVEHRAARTDRVVWISTSLEVLRDAQNLPRRLVGVATDITARKTWELETNRARDAAEAANKAKDEFLANMSHEIRTPLNGVLGMAGALALSALPAEQARMVQAIEGSGRALEALLTGVLDLVGAEAQGGRSEAKPLDLVELLNGLVESHGPTARAKGLELRLEGVGRPGLVVGDASRIQGVLTRLLDNAIKFTPSGAVILGLQLQPRGEKLEARFEVRDTGPGFDPAQTEALFARFHQSDGSNTRRFGGAGLGLAVCRALAAAMGGEVSATSAPGRGSRFSLMVPLERTAAEAGAGGAHRRAPRVLLAEDHPVNREVVRLILGSVGVDLTCVENGAEAVETAARDSFDLILMDVQMPVMDGLSAIRAIRAREASQGGARTPIQTLTANALPGHAAAAIAAGADAHMTKPVSAARLIAAVQGAAGTELSRAA